MTQDMTQEQKMREAFEAWYRKQHEPSCYSAFQAGTAWQRRQPFEPRNVNEDALELAIDCGELAYRDTEGDLHQAIKEAVQMYANTVTDGALEKFEKWYAGQCILNSIEKTDGIYCKPDTRRHKATWMAAISLIRGEKKDG